MSFNIYHHNDFDGLAGAALFAKFLNLKESLEFDQFIFNALDYNVQDTWESFELTNPCAIIDFLYHPKSDWWFDHHSSTFSNKTSLSLPYKRSEKKYWDTNFPSCPSLLISQLYKFFRKYAIELKRSYEDLIKWSDKIDGALYDSPSEIFSFDNIYMNINRTLAIRQDNEYYYIIIRTFFSNKLDELANSKMFQTLVGQCKNREQQAIDIISKIIEIDNKIALFDQSDYENLPFQRYLAYYLYPDIYYRIGIYKKNGKYSVSVNYNNWKTEENKINLGVLCKRLGGGGRYNVGAVLVDNHDAAIKIATDMRNNLKKLAFEQLAIPI